MRLESCSVFTALNITKNIVVIAPKKRRLFANFVAKIAAAISGGEAVLNNFLQSLKLAPSRVEVHIYTKQDVQRLVFASQGNRMAAWIAEVTQAKSLGFFRRCER